MSATVDSEKFSTYFTHCPILRISGRSYPVEVSFLYNTYVNKNYIPTREYSQKIVWAQNYSWGVVSQERTWRWPWESGGWCCLDWRQLGWKEDSAESHTCEVQNIKHIPTSKPFYPEGGCCLTISNSFCTHLSDLGLALKLLFLMFTLLVQLIKMALLTDFHV